jgi:hypothetical protein
MCRPPGPTVGGFNMMEAGTKRYALMITDLDKATDFFKKNKRDAIVKDWNKAYESALKNMSEQEASIIATKAVIGDGSNSGNFNVRRGRREKTKL